MEKKNFTVKPALCLDLDGTVRYSKRGDFIHKPEDIALYKGVEDVIWRCRERGYLVLGISNQGGIAYGLKTLRTVEEEIRVTRELFGRDPFDDIQYNPLHPGGRKKPFNLKTLLRKPETGMLAVFEAKMFNRGIIVDWENSLFVGDRPEDEECAQNAGIPFTWANAFFGRGS